MALLFRLTRRRCGNVLVAFAVTAVAIAGSALHWLARPHLFTLLFAGIFLLVLVQQNQQVNVLLSLQVQIQIAVATALSLPPARICTARLTHAT